MREHPLLLLLTLWPCTIAWTPSPKKYTIPLKKHVGQATTQISLYPADGPVVILEGSDVTSMFSSGKTPGGRLRLVAMYASWCPHCWHLVPHWVNAAIAFAGQSNIEICALNCADNANRDGCDAAHIEGFPTIQCFGCPKTPSCKGPGCNATVGLPQDKSPEQWVVDWIANVTNGAIKPNPGFVASSTKTSNHHIDILGPPGKNGWIPAYFMSADMRNMDAMRGFLSALWSRNDATLTLKALKFMYLLLGDDQYAPESPTSLSKTWKNSDLNALIQTLQGNQAGAREELKAWASKHAFGDITNQQAFPTFKDGMLQTGTGQYKTCTDFTCSLWEYLHVTTLMAAYFAGIGSKRLTPQKVMEYIHWFVKEFLTCESCKHHFLESYTSCEFARCEVQDWNGMVMWLWRVHEGVSLRTAAVANAPADRRWPSYEECPGCWNSNLITNPSKQASSNIDVQQIGKHPQKIDAPFNLHNVYQYLKAEYLGWSEVDAEKFELLHAPVRSPQQSFHVSQMLSIAVGIALVGIVASLSLRFMRKRNVPTQDFVLVEDDEEA